MIKIQEPRRPWEIVHMDWVTGLPPGGDRSYNACLVIVERFSKTSIFLPCHKDELAYKKSIHASTNQTPAVLEEGCNPRSTQDSLRKDLFELNPIAASFKGMLYKASKHAVKCMEDSISYAKEKWDKLHATPDLKVGDLVLVSTTNFNNIKVCKNLKYSFSGPFVIKALHGENAV
ncbi:hypothetical protein O181_040443 [Austropuccinia psidii MF-1]|uniref:Reverse transcriptase/retrotransposon-derived protein RNase H-like domain-containing protein n=1 Tax=Austropuccinia psidii MF-1 TaxID=1389203 RepID=A0A9Q3DH78_9BASI|nr:hypothetical protein [Austropuccinia psidii MF-1]